MKVVPDQLAPWLSSRLVSLGTDGFGRSDNREYLRRHFEVNAESVVAATLSRLAREGKFDQAQGPASICGAGSRYRNGGSGLPIVEVRISTGFLSHAGFQPLLRKGDSTLASPPQPHQEAAMTTQQTRPAGCLPGRSCRRSTAVGRWGARRAGVLAPPARCRTCRRNTIPPNPSWHGSQPPTTAIRCTKG